MVDVDGAGHGCAADDPEAIERLVAFGPEAYSSAEEAVVSACLTIEIGSWIPRAKTDAR